MHYIFVANGRAEMAEKIKATLNEQLEGLDISHEIYWIRGTGDGTRFVRIHCDLNPKAEECFIACGGSGTANEVASGIAGFPNKCMAMMPFGATNDVSRYYQGEGRDFSSIRKILEGETVKIDLLRANDNYSLNVINIGFDASVAADASDLCNRGVDPIKAYKRGVTRSILGYRYNKIRVVADGEKLNRRNMLMCTICNGRWCGGQYLCGPQSKNDDGVMEVNLFKTCTLYTFMKLLPFYTKGTFLDDDFCRHHIHFRRAKHVTLDSESLITVCLDGEIIASQHFDIDILPGHISLVLPKKED